MNVLPSNSVVSTTDQDVWLIYDGECPICRPSANALKIRSAVGRLHLINAREPHPMMEELNQAGLSIDEGMIVKFKSALYQGADAQHVLALIGTDSDWFNRLNVWLFRSKFLAKLIYPLLRTFRNILLKIKGIQKIDHLKITASQPIFKPIFEQQWESLPEILRKRYANRPYSNDTNYFKGELTINHASIMVFVLPILKLFKILVPYKGSNIPTTVSLSSVTNSNCLYFKRTFYFTDKNPCYFYSYMQPYKNNNIIEFIRFGFGCEMQCDYDGEKIIMRHQNYVWKIFNKIIPIPISFLFGKIYAEEQAITNDSFRMLMKITHPLFDEIFKYSGNFTLASKQ